MQNCMTMEWSDLRIFLAIARTGTLGAAARAIGQSQPTLGRRLRALEASLGHALFQRTSDGFVLTDEGQAALGHAERIEEEAIGLERRVAGEEHQLEGLVRIASSDWFASTLLVPVLAELGRKHPGIALELLTDVRQYSLSRREADLAFRIVPFREPDVIGRRLVTIPYAVYASRHAKWRVGGPELARVVTMDAALAEMPDAKWLRRMLPDATIALRSNSREVQARACAQGAGLAVLPRPLGDTIPDLVEVHLGEAPPSRDTFVGYHRDLRRVMRLRATLDLVVERVGGAVEVGGRRSERK
jgi:DNA-binding transcriptional LysR family regulator